MDDFITLKCPSCGGQIKIGESTSVFKCQHCGTEHIVRRQGDAFTLESYARCPKCGRNDRVEKVSSILKSQKKEIRSIENRVEYYRDETGIQQSRKIEVPIIQTQISNLARILIPPSKPKLKPKPENIPEPNFEAEPIVQKPISKKRRLKNRLLTLGSIMISISSCLVFGQILVTKEEPNIENFICIGILLLCIVIGIVMLVLSIKTKPNDEDMIQKWEQQSEQAKIDWQKEKEKAVKDWSKANQQRIEEWQQSNIRIQESWEYAMDNWDNLYFCHRDDCVFIPGKGTYAPIEEYEKYLYE